LLEFIRIAKSEDLVGNKAEAADSWYQRNDHRDVICSDCGLPISPKKL